MNQQTEQQTEQTEQTEVPQDDFDFELPAVGYCGLDGPCESCQ